MYQTISKNELGERRDIQKVFEYEKFILFGAGQASEEVFDFLQKNGKQVVVYADNVAYKEGKERNGLSIIAPDDIAKYLDEDTAIVIASSAQSEITTQLESQHKISPDRIFPYLTEMFIQHFDTDLLLQNWEKVEKVYSLLSDEESRTYFKNILKFRWTLDPRNLIPNAHLKGFYYYEDSSIGPQPGDHIVDCGAYIGDTAEMYYQRLHGETTITAIEAFPANYEKLVSWIKEHQLEGKIRALHCALGSKKGVLYMGAKDEHQDPRAALTVRNNNPELQVEIDTLDHLFDDRQVDFIKMDIEGAEIDTILGGASLVRKYKPEMAVASYHKGAHLWEIPLLIHSLDDSYQFYAGHHPKCIHETEYYIV